MNKIKFLFAALALIIAIGGAYASAKSFGTQTVYYVSGETCLEGQADFSCPIGSPNCFANIISGPPAPQQIFASRQLKPGSETLYDCKQPMDESVPPTK